MAEWPDPEDCLAHILSELTDHEVVTTLAGVSGPAGEDWRNLPEQVMPIIRATLLGGSGDQVTDWPRVEVVVYSTDPDEAYRIAGQARQLLLRGRQRTPAGVVDRAETEMRPYGQPTADPNRIRRVRAVYRISARQRWPQ